MKEKAISSTKCQKIDFTPSNSFSHELHLLMLLHTEALEAHLGLDLCIQMACPRSLVGHKGFWFLSTHPVSRVFFFICNG